MAEYWLKQNKSSTAEGPYTSKQLKKSGADGTLPRRSLISNDRARWQIAETVRGLFPPENTPEPIYDVAPDPFAALASPAISAIPANTIFCRHCGCANDRGATMCGQCQSPLYAPVAPGVGAISSPDIGQDAGMRMLLPVGRSPWAIVAGYMGLLSILVLPAPLAVIFSIIAIIDIKRHPDRHGMGRAIFGLVMGGLVLGVLVIGMATALFRK